MRSGFARRICLTTFAELGGFASPTAHTWALSPGTDRIHSPSGSRTTSVSCHVLHLLVGEQDDSDANGEHDQAADDPCLRAHLSRDRTGALAGPSSAARCASSPWRARTAARACASPAVRARGRVPRRAPLSRRGRSAPCSRSFGRSGSRPNIAICWVVGRLTQCMRQRRARQEQDPLARRVRRPRRGVVAALSSRAARRPRRRATRARASRRRRGVPGASVVPPQ